MNKLYSIIFAFFLCTFIVIICYKSSIDLLVTISADSEYLKYRVKRVTLSKVIISDFYVDQKINNCNINDNFTLSGLIEPGLNSEVTYRYSGNNLSIYIASNAKNKSYISFKDGDRCALPDSISFISSKKGQELDKGYPLPVAGPGQIGIEIGSQALDFANSKDKSVINLLHGGKLQIFGRAFGILDKKNKTLFPIKDGSYELPPGSRLSSEKIYEKDTDNRVNDDSLYGLALIKEKYLQIFLTTESNSIKLFRAGRSEDSEIIGIRIFSQLFNDPRIAWISIILVSFTISLQIWEFLTGFDFKSARIIHKETNRNQSVKKLPLKDLFVIIKNYFTKKTK
nr:hypothetical protein [uncultured Desulfobulbus sp.]